MRYVYMALIVVLTAIVLTFTFQNLALVTVRFLSMSATVPVALLAALVYVFGMLTGGSMLMLLRNWIKKTRK